MRTVVTSVATLICLAFTICVDSHSETSPWVGEIAGHPAAGDKEIASSLGAIVKKYGVPAIAGAIVTSKGLASVGVVGVRKSGTDVPVALSDKWHLGSDTKAMTAALVGKLTEQGRLRWDSTVAEVLPDIASELDPVVNEITVRHLLSHRAGLPANLDWWSISQEGTVQEQRLQAVKQAFSKPPEHIPGSEHLYSNLGYVVAGAMMEKVAGKSWERLMQDEIFGPLNMVSVGFGGTGTPGKIDQPWGHINNGEPVKANGPSMDNPPVLGPAGRVHCSIQDWAKFVADHLRGTRGEPALLNTETYKILNTPPFDGNYSLGWLVTEREWGGGTVLNHAGDNTMNRANLWIAPERNFAVLVCINQGGDVAGKASDEAAGELIKLHNMRNPASDQ